MSAPRREGWTIRLADDVYVLHEGKASFGELGKRWKQKNAKVLEAQHPGYHAASSAFHPRESARRDPRAI